MGLCHYFFVGVVEATGGVRRVLAIFHSPNALALFLGRGLPVAITLALFAGQKRWFYTAASLASLACLYLTYSRGAWLGVGCALLFVVVLRGSRRLLVSVGTAVAVTVGLLAFLPRGRLVSEATIEQRAAFEKRLGLDRSIPVQFVDFIGDIARLNFGDSLWQHRPAMEIVFEKLPLTLILAFIGIGLAFVLSIPLGIIAAL